MLKGNSTRELMRRAFVDLLEEVPYEKISVIDIAKQTGVSRQTFYVHFTSKKELALSFLDDMFYDFFDVIEPSLDRNDNQFLLETIYQSSKDNADKWNVVVACNIEAAVKVRYASYVRRLIGNVIRKTDAKLDDTFYVDCIIAHVAGTGLNLLQLWMAEGMPAEPTQMAKIHRLLLRQHHPGLVKDIKVLTDSF